MMTEHTPGPWRYTCRGKIGEFSVYVYVSGEPKGVAIAHLGLDTAGAGVPGGEREANARLISAAPDMRSLLRRLADDWDQAKQSCERDGTSWLMDDLERDTRALLAKTAGEA